MNSLEEKKKSLVVTIRDFFFSSRTP